MMMASERTAAILEEENEGNNSVFLCGDRQESSEYVATLMEYFLSIILNPSYT